MDNIFLLAYECLSEKRLKGKLALSRESSSKILSDNVQIDKIYIDTIIPGRPKRPILINPADLPRRNIKTIEGKAAMIHSFAHIEFNAINLAWDLICRFQNMPKEFYSDWAKVAAEETRHFVLLQKRLKDLGYVYGDFSAHDGLWQIAENTKHDVLLRLGVVPRILEARGLDVTPDLINRFHEIKDNKTISILEIILKEEVGHVQLGSKWFKYVCKNNNYDSEIMFKKIYDEFMPVNRVKKINKQARLSAGFSQAELDHIISIY